MTHDYKVLSQPSEYGGQDSLVVGDGTGLHISHTSNVTLYSYCRPLILQGVLYVTKIQKNFISVARLVADCNVLIEFVNNVCLIKDKTTRMLLLQRVFKGVCIKSLHLVSRLFYFPQPAQFHP